MNESLLHLILENNEKYARDLWPITLFCLLCLVIGLFGNGYVLFIYKFKLQTKGESRYFIPYLAIADACVSSFSCISYTWSNFHVFYFPWNFLCKGGLFLCGVPGLASPLFLLAIAVQRYTKTNPLGRHFSLTWRRVTVAIILIISTFCSVPFLLISGVGEISDTYKEINLTSVKCNIKTGQYPTFETLYFGFLALVLIINIVTILGLYVSIAVVVNRRQRESNLCSRTKSTKQGKGTAEITPQETEFNSIKSVERTDEYDCFTSAAHFVNDYSIPENETTQKRTLTKVSHSTRFNRMFLTIIAVYVLSVLPTAVMILFVNQSDLSIWRDLPFWKLQVYEILSRTFIINNIVNPFIYGYFDTQFRKYLKRLLPRFCCRKFQCCVH